MSNRLDARLTSTASSSLSLLVNNNQIPTVSSDFYTTNSLNYKMFNTTNTEFVKKTGSQYDKSGSVLSSNARNPVISPNTVPFTVGSIVSDSINNVYIGGSYVITQAIQVYDFNNILSNVGSFSLPSTGSSQNGYIIKFDSTGLVKAINVFQSASVDITGLSVDSIGSLYSIGKYNTSIMPLYNFFSGSSASFSSGWTSLFTMPIPSSTALFAVKWLSSGTLYGATFIPDISVNAGTRPQLNNLLITVDNSSNIYIASPFTNSSSTRVVYNFYTGSSASFSSGWTSPFVLTDSGLNIPSFIVKYSSIGTATSWTYVYSPTGSCPTYSYGLLSDTNIYLCGLTGSSTSFTSQIFDFTNTNTIGTFRFVNISANSGASQIGFIIKWSSSGVAISRTVLGNLQDYTIYSNLVLDSLGSLYSTGLITLYTSSIPVYDFSTSTTCDVSTVAWTTNFNFPALTSYVPFIVKWNSSGLVQSVGMIRTNQSISTNYGHSMYIDTSDSLYLGGVYSSSATVYNFFSGSSQAFSSGWTSAFTLPTPTTSASFIIKYDSTGNALMYYTSPISVAYNLTNYLNNQLPLINNLNVVGTYTNTIGIYNFSGSSSIGSLNYTLASASTNAVYFTKFYSTGVVDQSLLLTSIDTGPKMKFSADNPSSRMASYSYSSGYITNYASCILTDQFQNVYIFSIYGGTTTVPVYDLYSGSTNPVSNYFLSASPTYNGVILKYSSSGKLINTLVISGTNGSNFADACFINNNLYACGTYAATSTIPVNSFSNTGTYTFSFTLPVNSGNGNLFIIKWSNDIANSVTYVTRQNSPGDGPFYGGTPSLTYDKTGKIYVVSVSSNTTDVYNFYSTNSTQYPKFLIRDTTLSASNFIFCWTADGIASSICPANNGVLMKNTMITDNFNNLYLSVLTSANPSATYNFSSTRTFVLVRTFPLNTCSAIIKWNSNGVIVAFSLLNPQTTPYIYFKDYLYLSFEMNSLSGSVPINNFSFGASVASPFSVVQNTFYVVRFNGDNVDTVARITGKVSGASVGVCRPLITVDSSNNVYFESPYETTNYQSVYNFYKSSWIIGLTIPPLDTTANANSSGLYKSFIVKWNSSGIAQSYTTLNIAIPITTQVGLPFVMSFTTDADSNLYSFISYKQTAPITTVSDFSTSAITSASKYTLSTNTSGVSLYTAIIKWNSSGVVYNNIPRLSNIDTAVSNTDVLTKAYMNKTETIYVAGSTNTDSNNSSTLSSTLSSTGLSIISPPLVSRSIINTILNSSRNETASSITIDKFGNIFIAGAYDTSNSVVVYNRDGLTSFSLPAFSTSSYIIKFNQKGESLSYTPLQNMTNITVSTDSIGTLYTSGYFSSTSNVYSFSSSFLGQQKFIVPIGSNIINYSISGYVSSFTNFNGLNTQSPIVFDSFNNMYTTFSYIGSQNVYNFNNFSSLSPVFLCPNFGTSSVIVQYLSTGTANKFTCLGSSSTNSSNISAMTIDSADNLYASGLFYTNTLSVNNFSTSGTISVQFTMSQSNAIFTIQWATVSSSNTATSWSTIQNSTSTDTKVISDLTTDLGGSLYMTGYYRETSGLLNISSFTTTNPTAPTQFFLPTSSVLTGFISVWSYLGLGLSYWYFDNSFVSVPKKLIVNNNNFYLTGSYNNTSSTVSVSNFYYTTTPVNVSSLFLPATSSDDTFIIKWNSNGTVSNLNRINDTGAGSGLSMSYDNFGGIHLVGYFSATTESTIQVSDFFTTTTSPRFFFYSPTSSTDAFYIKWLDTGITDLGSYTSNCYVSLQGQSQGSYTTTSGVIVGYKKQVLPVVPNYLYNISFPLSSTVGSTILSNNYNKMEEFLWSSNSYSYLGPISSQSYISYQQQPNLSVGLISKFASISSFSDTNPVVNTFTTVMSFGQSDQQPTGTSVFTIKSTGTYQLSSQFMYIAPTFTTFSLSMGGTSAFSEISPSNTANWVSGSIYQNLSYGQTISVSSQVSANAGSCSMASTNGPCLFSLVKIPT